MKLKAAMILTTSLITMYAQSAEYTIGAGAGTQQSIYKGTDNTATGFPLLSYEGEHFFLQGVSAGYKLLPADSEYNLMVKAYYDFAQFDPSDSDNAQMKLLNKRDSAIMAGIGYELNTSLGVFQTGVYTDVSDEHDGTTTEVMWTVPMHFGGWAVNATVGYHYSDSNYNNHFYGISAQEAATSGLAAYDLDWAGLLFTGIQSYRRITENFTFGAGVSYTIYDDDIYDSPMVDDRSALGMNVSLSYTF